jgi:integrase
MGLYRRGEIYWFTLMYEGKRIQESLHTKSKQMAERAYAKTLTEIIEGRYFEVNLAKQIRFEEMAIKYLEEHRHSRDEHTVKKLHGFFKGMTLYEITTKKVAEYRKLRVEVAKPATVYQELALLRRMFNVAIREWEWLRDNPVSRLSFSVGTRNARDRWLTPEEEKKLLEKATNPHWLRPLLVTALHTGLRKGELLALTWKDIDFAANILRVERSKNGEKRALPLSRTVQSVLKGIKVRSMTGRVFPISVRSLRVAFEAALEKAEIENFHFHDLRHSFATRLVQNGVDLYKVKELLGHKSVSMTMRYAHHYPESLRASVEVLDDCYNFTTMDPSTSLTPLVEPHKIR